MSETGHTQASAPSRLHSLLKGHDAAGINGKIDLFQRLSEIKEAAPEWLKGLGKNGFEHSERLEHYLDALCRPMLKKDQLGPGEIFVLLSAAYMHDVGYALDGELVSKGHPERSRDRILGDPAGYRLHDFPPFQGNAPRAVEAVAWVAHGHSDEKYLPLEEVDNAFPDQALGDEPLNLRKLTALLRLADEADDPYIRVKGSLTPSIRSTTPLVRIGAETIAWHWKHAGVHEPDTFIEHLKEKTRILVSSTDYLRDLGAGNWYLVLDPQVAGTAPFMAEKPVETFVGREHDLEKIHAIVQGRRTGAITGVTGTGGIGKTELARMYAEKYGKAYPGGVFWASLKGSHWKSEAEKLLAALRPGADPVYFPDNAKAKDEVTKALARTSALLVIDNVDEADDIIRPECAVLVTTRNKGAFGILPAESLYALDRFVPKEGLDLLEKILGATRVHRDLQGAERLIDILGGMPLAVEIAAKQLVDSPDTSFPQYIGWIQGQLERLRLEDLPDKDVIASLSVSLDLLEKEEHGRELSNLFDAASVCAESGFTSEVLGVAAGLQDLDSMVLQQLVGKLHHRSLLEYSEASQRYSLHPLLRHMAESRLGAEPERQRACKENHCTYFLHFAEAHNHRPEDLIREKDGLRLAMVQAIQLGWEEKKLPLFLNHLSKPFFKHLAEGTYEAAFQYLVATNLIDIDELGLSRELVDLLTPLLENRTRLQASSLAWVLNNLGLAYKNLGKYHKVMAFHKQALAIHRRIGDVRGEGVDLSNMGLAYANLGEYRKAIGLYGQALKIFRKISDLHGEGANIGNMGVAYANLGEYRKAIDLFEQHLEIARRIGNVRNMGSAMGNMGLAYKNLGEYHKAIDFNKQQLEITRRLGDVRGEGNALNNMGLAYLNLEEYRKAIELHEQALEIDRRIGDVRGEGKALNNMGLAYAGLGECRKAIEFHEQYLKIARSIGDARGEGNALGNMGLAFADLGEYRKAVEFYEQAIEIDRRIGNVWGEGSTLGNMGGAHVQLGDGEKARQCFAASLRIFQALDLPHMVDQVRRMAGEAGIEIE